MRETIFREADIFFFFPGVRETEAGTSMRRRKDNQQECTHIF